MSSSGMNVTAISSELSDITQNSFTEDIYYLDVVIDRRAAPIKDPITLIRLIYIYRKHRFDLVHSTTPKAGLLSEISVKFSGRPISLHTFTGQPWVSIEGARMVDSTYF